jgi:hypothetical protein
MEIECLVCGCGIELSEFIDVNDYDGQVACGECDSLLHIRLKGSKIKGYEVVEKKFRTPKADDLFRMWQEIEDQFGR